MSKRVALRRYPGIVGAVLLMLLAGCGAPAEPTAISIPASPAVVATATTGPAAAAPTREPNTTPSPPAPTTGPDVGGSLAWSISIEPDTFDPHLTSNAASSGILTYIGGALLAKDADGKLVPYQAESWSASPDGLTWTFALRKGIRFHNGDALTAEDYVWTYSRARSTASQSSVAANMLAPITGAKAADDYTLVLTLSKPFYPILNTLTSGSYLMPLSRNAVSAAGDQYGRNPVGTGPYKFKSWTSGVKVVLERNPDYGWGPAFWHEGPMYISTVEFRIISDYAMSLAGLQSGGLDLMFLQATDGVRLSSSSGVRVVSQAQQGLNPAVFLNVNKAPFNDLRVRQALAYAIDAKAIVSTVYGGAAVVQRTALSPSMDGYSKTQDAWGYRLDLARARQLLKDAGYVGGTDGSLTRDGVPFTVHLYCTPDGLPAALAQVLATQWKQIGVGVEITQQEQGVLVSEIAQGKHEADVLGVNSSDADILYSIFHSSQIGSGMNLFRISDRELDALLESTRTEIDPGKRQADVDATVKYIADNALVLPICAPLNYTGLSSRLAGYRTSAEFGLSLADAYIQD